MDSTKFILDRVRLTDEAVMPATTSNGFARDLKIDGKGPHASAILSFKVDNYAVVKVRGLKVRDGHWWATHIEAVLPSLLHGHNGRPIKTAAELALALTRLVHIVKAVVQPQCHQRILPGVGPDNRGYIRRWEAMIQIVDAGHAFLLGCHLAKLKHQQKTCRIHPTESTTLRTREVDVSIYDKHAKLRYGLSCPEDVPGTRIEVIVKDKKRLVREVKSTGLFTGTPGPVLATLNLATEYQIILAALKKVTGIGHIPDRSSLEGLCKNAKLIVGSLGAEVTNIGRVAAALQAYKMSCGPNPNTFRRVEQDVRAYAVRVKIPDPLALIPADHSNLRWSEVHWEMRERQWAVLMRDINAPDEADPAIAAAWSVTSFLPALPPPYELFGGIAPGKLPFLKTL